MPKPHAFLPAGDSGAPIIVHSHLRWDFVWQRPQQLLSRLSERHPVLFVEEPLFLDDVRVPRLDLSTPEPHVHRAVPVLPADLRGDYDRSIAVVRDMLRAQLTSCEELQRLFARPVQWFYTPMPAPAMIGAFDERAVVYDCMDELANFRFAPPALTDRERLLIASADVVFTGGYRLWKSKSRNHDNVHFFGCGVDVEHFARARSDDLQIPEEIASLGTRVMGYYGVIDERIDYPLLSALAAANPRDAVVMVGPAVKVDPAELPQAPNIHWLGQRRYDELPGYVKGFDVCLMPFALNEATAFINPTKTLEYMAAGKPIVSTAVSDVKHHFVPVVAVAESHAEFITMARHALHTPNEAMIARGIELACENTWESVVCRMERIMEEAIRARDVRVRESVRARRAKKTESADASWTKPDWRVPAVTSGDAPGD
jgi:glycosyltransferase involved in cell wall biosynthesis